MKRENKIKERERDETLLVDFAVFIGDSELYR
jgi:hypothetical protein